MASALDTARPAPLAPVRVGVVGAGYWGRNLVRSLGCVAGFELGWVCDREPRRLEVLGAHARGARLTTTLDDPLADSSIDALLVAIHAPAQAAVAIRALEAGKHVFVEKPLALSMGDAERVVRAAEHAGRLLMLGLTYRYNPLVDAIAATVQSGSLGEIRACFSQRSNLTVEDQHTNALWALAPHDVSILHHLFGEPSRVAARGNGHAHGRPGASAWLCFDWANGARGWVFVSLVDPPKRRLLVIVGERRALVLDELAPPARRLRIVDAHTLRWNRDASVPEVPAEAGNTISARDGEPLVRECEHFLACIRTGSEPRTGRRAALDVTRILEALQRSLDGDGSVVDPRPLDDLLCGN